MRRGVDVSACRPVVVKYTQPNRNGIQVHSLRRCAIGYVLHGKRHFYYGDEMSEVGTGEVFCLGLGSHYIEDVPDDDKPFEQIVFYCDEMCLNKILNGLNVSYGVDIINDHACHKCRKNNHVGSPASDLIRDFFVSVNNYIADGAFSEDEILADMKLSELMYMIVTSKDCCIKNKLLEGVNPEITNFQQIIQANIFSDMSIAELAEKCHKSPTSFKKEFRRVYNESPHKWLIKQRLMKVRMLLVSTNKPVSEIGAECMFPNTSHFIKLFKKEYGMTPAEFRQNNRHYGDEGDVPRRTRVKKAEVAE